MRFNIKDPANDHNPILLNAIPTAHEGEQAFKIIFPEGDSITMVKKNKVWTQAAETDLCIELLKAISQGIHLHIEQHNQSPQKQIKFKITAMKNMLPILLLTAGMVMASSSSHPKNKNVDSLMSESSATFQS